MDPSPTHSAKARLPVRKLSTDTRTSRVVQGRGLPYPLYIKSVFEHQTPSTEGYQAMLIQNSHVTPRPSRRCRWRYPWPVPQTLNISLPPPELQPQNRQFSRAEISYHFFPCPL